MGFGYGGCGFDRSDCCIEGYGDGPCGGYYSYWDKCRGFPGHGWGKGCCNECGCGRGCCNECGRGFCNECGCGRGCCNECGCGKSCCNRFGFPDCGRLPLGCGQSWRNPPCGLFLNIPFGGSNMGFFMPLNNKCDTAT